MLRRTLVVAFTLMSSTVASAEELTTFLGWSASGDAVMKVKDEGQVVGYSRCTPVVFETHGSTALNCTSCAAGTEDPVKACGLVKRPLKSSATSPDKKLTLKKEASCDKLEDAAQECTSSVQFPNLGAMWKTEHLAGKKDKKSEAGIWFRPDSNAVVVAIGNVAEGVTGDSIAVIDVAALRGRGTAPVAVRTRVTAQLASVTDASHYTDDAILFTDEAARAAIAPAVFADAVKASGALKPTGPVTVGVSFDGRSAWATFTAATSSGRWRVSELLVRDGADWRISSGYWSRGLAAASAQEQAQAGKLPKPVRVAAGAKDEVAADLVKYVQTLRSTKDEAKSPLSLAAARPDVAFIGIAPAERATGPALEKTLRGWILGGMTVTSVRGVSDFGIGWLIVNLEVTKTSGAKSYTLPVRAWIAVDDSGDNEHMGAVVSHFSIVR